MWQASGWWRCIHCIIFQLSLWLGGARKIHWTLQKLHSFTRCTRYPYFLIKSKPQPSFQATNPKPPVLLQLKKMGDSFSETSMSFKTETVLTSNKAIKVIANDSNDPFLRCFFSRKFLRDGSLGILCWCECVHHYTLTASFEWIFLGNLTWAIFLVCQRLHHFGCATNCHVSVRKRRSSFVFWVFMGYLCVSSS